MAWIDTPLEADVAQTYVLPAEVPIRAEQHDRIFRPDGLDVGVLADELDQACTENPVLVASLGPGITELCRAAAEASSAPAPTVSEHYARLGLRYLPYDVALRVHLAEALRRLGRLDEAVIHGEAVVSIDRRDRSYQPAFWVAHAASLHELGRNDEALAIVEDPGPNWAGVAGHAELVNAIRSASGMAPPPVVDDNTVARPETGAMPVAPPMPPSPSAPPPPPAAPTPPPAPPAAPAPPTADHTAAMPAAATPAPAPEPAIVAPGPNTISDNHTVRFGGEEVVEPVEPEPEERERRGLLFPVLLLIVLALAGALIAVFLGYVDLGGDETATPAGDGPSTTEPTSDPTDDDPGDEPTDEPSAEPDPEAETIDVPATTGFSTSVAAGLLERAGFEFTERTEPSYDVDPGQVVGTEPAAGTPAEAGAEVTMIVATRPAECNDIVGTPSSSFTDIGNLDSRTRLAVSWAVDVGLVGDGNEFNPTKATTRSVALTVLWRYMCEPTAGTADFDDVPDNAFYADAVDWAASSGVVSGKSPSEFKPDDPITRAEFITIVWRAFGSPAAPDSLPFEDVPTNAFYREALEWAHDAGIVNGTSPTTFDPEGDLDRVTTIVLFNRIERQIDPLLGPFD